MANETLLSSLREAGEYLGRRSQVDSEMFSYKGAARDVVSAADRYISDLFKKIVPSGFSFVSEEDFADLNLHNCVLIDPLDGTFNYLTGSPDYCVMASLIEGGRITEAGIIAPATGSICYLNSKSGLIVEELDSQTTVGAGAPIYYAYSPELSPQFEAQRSKVLKLIDDEGVGFVRYGSAGIGLLRCIEGYLEGFIGHNVRIWDVFPLMQILFLRGFRLTLERRGYLCDIIIHKDDRFLSKMSKILGSGLKPYAGAIE